MLSFEISDLSLELPFTLTHPKPKESPPPSRPVSAAKDSSQDGNSVAQQPEINLIQLDVG